MANGWERLGEVFAGTAAGGNDSYSRGVSKQAQLAQLLAGAQIKQDEAMARDELLGSMIANGTARPEATMLSTMLRMGADPTKISGYHGDVQTQGFQSEAMDAARSGNVPLLNDIMTAISGRPRQTATMSEGTLFDPYGAVGQTVNVTPVGQSTIGQRNAAAAASYASAANSRASAAKTRQDMLQGAEQFGLEKNGLWSPGGKAGGGAGGAAGPGKLTEGQGKDIVYFSRGRDSNALLQKFGDNLLMTQGNQGARGILDSALRGLPFVGDSGLVNGLISSDRQQAQQAAAEFLSAILRKDTGAAITKQEFDIYGPMYLPMPGDSAETLEQKAVARQGALEGIKAGLGNAQAAIPAPRERSRLEMPSAAAAFGGSVPPAAPVQRARNPQTGQVLVLINGQWVPE
nr:hypothetical protein [Stenotrophomonas geniculata]